MKRSVGLEAEVPDGVVTVTVTAPAVCGGVTTVSVLGEVNVTLAAGVVSKETVVVFVNPVPVMVTVVPPVTDPDDGATPVTVGAVKDDGEDADVT